ncbi:zinc-binding dehydrogenase [Mycobacterium botniense]|uniref:Putative zinc-binding alcohol dehydrogenase n=1 Tax=Mycobacterium botniense TaxID=84962 RepID=A0A7I9Y1Q1_9MYCO|nr:alcohol dehydrogenase catalytic domain-containing protein [Mycobacterium botniense]GFG75907.1 putative zinc-binding alcohol dehydrogenase [Mycobacterium botniense]
MRAVIIDAPGSIRVDRRPDPGLTGPDGAIVAVNATGICGSDLHFYEGEYPLTQPVALGHEAVGTVVETGPQVQTVRVGEVVMVSSVAGCGACPGCATRDPVMCHAGPQIFGSGVLGGAQADLLAVPAADFQLRTIPEQITTEQALLLTDNLATGWAAARRADIPLGGTVAVIGLGAVGLCALRSAFAQGAATVFGVDPVAGRRERAARDGVIPVEAPAAEAIVAATGGRGADAVIDAVGTDASMTDALAAVRPGGTVSVVGVHNLEPFPLPALTCLLRSITLRMTTAPVQRTWPELIPLLQSGRLTVDGIITTTLPLDEAAHGYAVAASRSGDQVKIVLTPGG